MKFRKVCKCLTAWTLTAAMTIGGSGFAWAGELTDDGAALDVEVAELAAPEEDAAVFGDAPEAPAEAPVEAVQAEELFGDGADGDFSSGAEDADAPADGEQDPGENPIRIDWDEDEYGNEAPGGGFYTWLFPDQIFSLFLAGDLPEGYTAEWNIQSYNTVTEEALETAFVEEVSSSDEELVIKGLTVNGDFDGTKITAVVKDSEGNEIASPWIDVFVQPTEYEYFYEGYDKNYSTMLPEDGQDLGRDVRYFMRDAEHPYGDNIWIPFTSAEITEQYKFENGEEIPVDSGVAELIRNDDGWYWVRGIDYGHAVVTVTHPVDEESDEIVTRTFDFYVQGDRYWLETIYPIPQNRCMQPGDEMNVTTLVHHQWFRSDEDRGYEQVADYRLEVAGEQEEQWPVEAAADGKTLVLKAKDQQGEAYIPVNVVASNGDILCSDTVYVGVWEGYWRLTIPQEENDVLRNLAPGQSVQIHPEFAWVTKEGASPVEDTYRYSWDWDAGCVEITDADGKKLDPEAENGNVGNAPFTLKKLRNDGTGLYLRAEVWDENDEQFYECAGYNLNCDGLDYSTWLEMPEGKDRWDENHNSWMYSDEDFVLSLNQENLEGRDYEVEWLVGSTDEEGNFTILVSQEDGFYTADNKSITLHGAKIAERFVPNTETGWVDLRAIIKVNGEEVGGDGLALQVRQPTYDIYWPYREPGEMNMLMNDARRFPEEVDARIENGEYPFGLDTVVKIKNVEPVISWEFTEDGEQETEQPIVDAVYEDDGWTLVSGDVCGYTRFRITYESVETGEEATWGEDPEDPFEMYVLGDTYGLELNYPLDSDCVLVDESMVVETRLWHDWRDENGDFQTEFIEDYELSLTWDEDGTPTYDTDWVTAEVVGGTAVRITPKGEDQAYRDRIFVRAMVPDGEGGRNEVADANMYINVTYEYSVILPNLRLTTPEGQILNIDRNGELDLNEEGLKIVSYGTEGKSHELSGENYRIRMLPDGWDPSVWTVKEGTEDDLLPVLIRNGEYPEWSTSVTVCAEERQLDDDGKPAKDDEGNEIWNEFYRTRYDFDSLCEEEDHSWVTTTVAATVETPKLVIDRCAKCGVETREYVGRRLPQTAVLESASVVNDTKIRVTWKALEEVDGYFVYRKMAGGTWKRIGAVGASAVSYTDAAVAAGTPYLYTIRGYQKTEDGIALGGFDGKGISGTLLIGTAELKSAAPAAYNKITVTWNKLADADSYFVYRKTAGTQWKRVGIAGAAATSYTDTGVETGTTYTYTVRGYRRTADGFVLGGFDAKGVSAAPAPAAVTLGKAAAGRKGITVTWKKVAGATGYRVYRKTANGKWKAIKNVNASRNSYTDKTVKKGTTYFYTVKAFRTVNGKKILSASFDRKGISAKAK